MKTKHTLLIVLLSLTAGILPAFAQGGAIKGVGKEILESAGKVATTQVVRGIINSTNNLSKTFTPNVSVSAIKPASLTQETSLTATVSAINALDLQGLPDPAAVEEGIAKAMEQLNIFSLRNTPRFSPAKVVSGTVLSAELIHLSDTTIPRPSPKMAPKQGNKRSNRK